MRLFISYRREDSAGYTGRLYDHLTAHFGNDKIFMDIDTIKLGQDFVDIIETEINKCNALVAVIGKEWLTLCDETGARRLDNPLDFVRLEIAQALERQILVVPVLVDNAKMPTPDDLPENLKKLARRNALALSHERFRYDIGRLIEVLAEADKNSPSKIAENVNLAGLWVDPISKVEVFFKQKNQYVAGYYALPDKKILTKWGVYIGELMGHVFEFKWRWLNDTAMYGQGRVIVSGNRQKISGHYWVGKQEEVLSVINFNFVGSHVPSWLKEEDLANLEKFLQGK